MNKLVLPGVILLLLALLYPYLLTGFTFDDSLNASVRGTMEVMDNGIWVFILKAIRQSLTEGRFYPFSALVFAVFYYCHDLWVYRLGQVIFAIFNIGLFSTWLKAYAVKKEVRLLSCLFLAGLFQLRDYHDPIVAYGYLMQASLMWGLGSLILMEWHLKKKYGWALWASFFCLICTLMSYEVNLVFALIALFITATRKAWKPFLGYAGVTGLYLAVVSAFKFSFYAHHSAPAPMKLSAKVVYAYICQTTASLPFFYALFGRSGFLHVKDLIGPEFISFRSLGIFLTAAGVCYLLLKQLKPKEPIKFPKEVIAAALFLFIFPAFLIALTTKYQNEINRPGSGYLPVYLSYFGSAILLLQFFGKKRNPKRFSILFGLWMTFAFTTNLILARATNSMWKNPRMVIEGALESHLLDSLKGKKWVINGTWYPWFNANLVRLHSNGQLDFEAIHRTAVKPKDLSSPAPFVAFGALNGNQGWLLQAEVHVGPKYKLDVMRNYHFWIYSDTNGPAWPSQIEISYEKQKWIAVLPEKLPAEKGFHSVQVQILRSPSD